MAVTRLEVNVRRLLKKCEHLAKENSTGDDCRLQKYVDSLDAFIMDLHNVELKPSKDDLDKYRRRVEYLKGVLQAKKMPSTIQKAIATQMLPVTIVSESTELKEMHRKLVAQSENELRQELFQSSSESTACVKRRAIMTPDSDENIESATDFYRLKQEKISEDMLAISQSMREQSKLAGEIIRKDIGTLEKSNDLMDKNQTHLQKSSSRLEAFIAKTGWNCWIWIMLAVIFIVFINMIFFMKVSKKKY